MTVIRTPFDKTKAEQVELADDKESGVMWKMLIPMNYKLDYKGRKLHFDRSYLSNIKSAFKEGATGDQVAYQLATDDNEHDTAEDRASKRHFDPERYRGEVTDLKLVNSGLWGKYQLTPEGYKLIKENPKLGVSVSLKENFERDGKTYPVVMRHVLGTLSPRIKGMPPWQADEVTLSDDDDEEVLDLTMPTTETDETVEVKKSDWDAVQKFMQEQREFNTALADSLEDEDDDDESDDDTDANLSDDDDDEDDPRIIEMSAKLAATEKRQKASDDKAAKAEFNRYADKLANAGVPKAMIDLARPICETSDEFEIQLSDGSKADPRETILALLDEAKGFIDMADEDGHGIGDDANDEQDELAAIAHDFMDDEF